MGSVMREGRPGGGGRGGAIRPAAGALALLVALAACSGGGGGGGAGSRSPDAGTRGAASPGDSRAGGPALSDAGPYAGWRPSGPDWPTYGGDPGGTRFSSLTGIDTSNVGGLREAWTYHTGVPGPFEATPIVVDGALYVTTPMDGGEQRVVKLDAATGDRMWEARVALDRPQTHPQAANRGVAVAGGRVFLATLDARLVALDARDGSVLWAVRTAPAGRGYGHKQAPLARDAKVFLGVSGSPYGIRGFVKAFDAASGRELWTWRTIPSPEEGGWWGTWTDTLPGTDLPLPRDVARERADSARYADAWRRGGGAPWMTPSLDPERGLLFVSTGNPAPELTGATRPGDDRWSVSVCAIRTADGTAAWCWQILPHDVWGLDAASPPFLFAGRSADGEAVPAVGHFSKLGFFYAWDRRSGELLTRSDAYVPHRNFLARPTPEGVEMAPGIYGGTEWSPAAWSPETGLAYGAALHAPGRYRLRTSGERAGTVGFDLGPAGERRGWLVAVDPSTGRIAWRSEVERPLVGGVLATAGGLVFAGRLRGTLDAWDAATGRHLWSGEVGPGCASGPVAYRAGGRTFVAVACGGHFLGGGRGDALRAFALSPRAPGAP